MTIHAKKSVQTVWCGQGIFGKLTDAEGYTVDCPRCIEEKKKDAAKPRMSWVDGKYGRSYVPIEPECSKCGRVYCDHENKY